MSAPIAQPTARGSGSPAAIWTALSLVYVAWSTTFVGISVVNETMPPLLGGGLRFLIAGGLLLPDRAPVRRPPRRPAPGRAVARRGRGGGADDVRRQRRHRVGRTHDPLRDGRAGDRHGPAVDGRDRPGRARAPAAAAGGHRARGRVRRRGAARGRQRARGRDRHGRAGARARRRRVLGRGLDLPAPRAAPRAARSWPRGWRCWSRRGIFFAVGGLVGRVRRHPHRVGLAGVVDRARVPRRRRARGSASPATCGCSATRGRRSSRPTRT